MRIGQTVRHPAKKLYGNARRSILCALTMSAVVILSGCAPSAGDRTSDGARFPSDITERLNATVADAMTLSGSSGALVGVWVPGTGEWVVTPGTTTLRGTVPLNTKMRFRIGTNTTAMTCTVLLKLVDEHRVKLSDPVSTYLNRVVGIADITLGQLCQNTSGLADYATRLASEFVRNPTRRWPPMELISNSLAAPLSARPGSVWVQSSTDTTLLGMALKAATRQDWGSLYRQYIFGPLGLADTSLPNSKDLEIPGPHPHGYATALSRDGQSLCETVLDDTSLSNSMTGVAGGVVSTLADMRIWAETLATGSMLSDSSAKKPWTTVPLNVTTPSRERNGLGAKQIGSLRGSAGTIPGFISAILADPDRAITVVVALKNSSAGDLFAQTLALRLAAIAAGAPSTTTTQSPTAILPRSEEPTGTELQTLAVCPPPLTPTG
jgi:D-alanyl-D-alanine carboxypeptidase